MQEEQFIVDRLNAAPFRKGLSLVTFDDQAPHELLQLLNDVFAELDPAHKMDVRDEAGGPEQTATRMLNFLQIIKYNVPPDDLPKFKEGLLAGERNVIYPVLHYILSKLDHLKKRAYIARFLVNIQVPPEFMHEEAVVGAYERHQQLQAEFKEVHRTADKLRSSTLAPGELKTEITQLEEERAQLLEKIEQLKRKTSDVKGFAPLLEATSALRREQEEETKLQERMMEQRIQLAQTERRYNDMARRLGEARSAAKNDVSARALLERARREASESRRLVHEDLPKTIAARHETLEKLQRILEEPAKTEEDVLELRHELRAMEAQVESMNKELVAASAKGDSKLGVFRQQSALIAKKLQQAEAEVEAEEREGERLGRDIEAKQAKLSEVAGSKFMTREEFKTYASQLRNKTNRFKKMKAELSALRQETVTLVRTEQILRSRDAKLDEFLSELEKKKGIEGYTKMFEEQERISGAKAAVDETKGKTLNEISRIVTDIQHELKSRKSALAPQIKELKDVRVAYTELEATYLAAKAQFEHLSAGLDSERLALEQECDALQEECLREESSYHYLNSLTHIASAHLERVMQEAKFAAGEGSLLRDFRTWEDLYRHKVSQQEALAKQLRVDKKRIAENEGPNMKQRAMFQDLEKILKAKLATVKEPPADAGADAGLAIFDEMGGANVMTLGD